MDDELIQALKQRGVWYVPTLGLDESFYLFAAEPTLLQQPVLQHAMQPALATQLTDPAWKAKVLGDSRKLAMQKQALAMNSKNLKTLDDAGVNIGFGTDSGAAPLRIPGFAEHRELKLLVDAGLTPLQALTLATSNAARLLGLDDRGTLTSGKLADLVVVKGNPADDIAAMDTVVAVFRRGQRSPHVIGNFMP